MSENAITMHDSGIRGVKRRAGAWIKGLLPYVIPMAPRNNEKDKSMIAWRSFMTAGVTLMTSLLTYISTHLGSSDANLQNTMERIERRMGALELKVEAMNGKVEYVSAFVDGMRKTPH